MIGGNGAGSALRGRRRGPEAGARERPLFHRDRRQLERHSAARQVTPPGCSVGNYVDQDLSIVRVDSDQIVGSDRPPPASPGAPASLRGRAHWPAAFGLQIRCVDRVDPLDTADSEAADRATSGLGNNCHRVAGLELRRVGQGLSFAKVRSSASNGRNSKQCSATRGCLMRERSPHFFADTQSLSRGRRSRIARPKTLVKAREGAPRPAFLPRSAQAGPARTAALHGRRRNLERLGLPDRQRPAPPRICLR